MIFFGIDGTLVIVVEVNMCKVLAVKQQRFFDHFRHEIYNEYISEVSIIFVDQTDYPDTLRKQRH